MTIQEVYSKYRNAETGYLSEFVADMWAAIKAEATKPAPQADIRAATLKEVGEWLKEEGVDIYDWQLLAFLRGELPELGGDE